MKKRVQISRESGANEYRTALHASAAKTQSQLTALAKSVIPLELLFKLKFGRSGYDPINSNRSLNLIEQLNQTFTYLASLDASEVIFKRSPQVNTLTLNLGTTNGWDIESSDDGGLVAEVFASVTPNNNGKLVKDIKRVAAATTKHRYVFFMCPGFAQGHFSHPTAPKDLVIWSLACGMCSPQETSIMDKANIMNDGPRMAVKRRKL